MQIFVETPDQYFEQVPEHQKEAMNKLREVIKAHIPEGFEEAVGSGMVGYQVPYSIYPAGYHCKPKQPLPFVGIAAQKHFIAVYHMGIYSDENLLKWFLEEYPKATSAKLDMGKSCIRFKKPESIPFELIGKLMEKMTVEDWIGTYEKYHLKNGA